MPERRGILRSRWPMSSKTVAWNQSIGFRVPFLARQIQDTDERWKVLGGHDMSRL